MYDSYLIDAFSYEWYKVNILSLIGTVCLLLLISILLSIENFKEYRFKKKISRLLGFFLLIRFLVSNIFSYSVGSWDINHSLPFHLCGISSVLSIIILFKYNQFIYEFLVLLGAPGALWSFLTPQINVYEPSYMYVDYFISHSAIIFVPIFLTIFLNKRPRPLSYLKIFFIVNVLVIPIVGLINIMIKKIFNSDVVNYMYLIRPPLADNPFIVDSWLYMIILEFTAFMHMILIYSIFVFFSKFRGNYSLERRFS